MRHFISLLLPILLLSFLSSAYAQGTGPSHGGSSSSMRSGTGSEAQGFNRHGKQSPGREDAAKTPAQLGRDGTYLVVDEAGKRIKVVVEGKEVAYFHKGGLSVDGAVTSSNQPVGGGR